MPQDIDFGDPIQFGSNKPQTVASAIKQNGARPMFSQMHAQTQQVSAPMNAQAPIATQAQVVAHNPQTMTPLPRFAGQAQSANPQAGLPQTAPGLYSQGAFSTGQTTVSKPLFNVPQQPLPSPEGSGGSTGKKIMMVVIGVATVAIVGGISYLLYARFSGSQATQNNQVNTFVTNTTQSGSNSNKDEDDDGLLNFEEVNYGTDPNKADTDGDGFEDGAEVEKGFDPKGPGKLPTPGRF